MNKTVFACLMLGSLTTVSYAGPVKSVRVILPVKADPVMKNIGQVFVRQVQQRCQAKVVMESTAPLTVELAVAREIGAEGFRIEDRPGGGVRILGSDEKGLLYGVGKFLRSSRYDQGGFTPGTWRGMSVPEKPVRGIYLATHFYNYYHAAPIAEVERYVEDLGLWGFNTFMIWYDMHHFESFDAPESREFLVRARAVLNAARRIGLDTALVLVSNEGFKGGPKIAPTCAACGVESSTPICARESLKAGN